MSMRRVAAIALVVAACGGATASSIDPTTLAPSQMDKSSMPWSSTPWPSTPRSPSTPQPSPSPPLFTATTAPSPPTPEAFPATAAPQPTPPPATTTRPEKGPPLEATPAEDAHAVVMAGFGGHRLDTATEAHLAAGGRAVVLFGRNIESRLQVRDLTQSIACSAAAPVIVAVDQEPGRVARLAPVDVRVPRLDSSAVEYAADASVMATEMLALGINLDLAPVADVVRGENPVLAGRNLGPDAEFVSSRTISFIEALRGAGVGATAKHFPGHGLARVDPHRDVTVIGASLKTLEKTHFPPFFAAIEADVSAVMVGHPIYEALDPTTPASLSPAVLGMLRVDFKFDGVAVTDGLSMAGLRKLRTIEEIAVEAIAAGSDLLLADRPSDVPRIVSALLDGIESGVVSPHRLAEAAGRVRRLAADLTPVACDR